ncbi:hypothetical protein [Methanoculleus sp.]|uniref:hypothetical protein n=1 Tax=Methanoculleus sp. TaxID=90427 RepID=UPI0025E21336|nr:hypothetical protein [Methanoculleus sp.]MCK9320126.1 hypothetical protein [Methanoculleus sp.]
MKKAIVLDFTNGCIHIIHLDENIERDIDDERIKEILDDTGINSVYEFIVLDTDVMGNLPINEIFE